MTNRLNHHFAKLLKYLALVCACAVGVAGILAAAFGLTGCATTAYVPATRSDTLLADAGLPANVRKVVYRGPLEINMFSASLNRDNLKEDVLQLLHKYGRQTEKEFTMFGILTQSGKEVDDILSFVESKVGTGDAGLRIALLNVTNLMNGIDKTVTGRLDKDYLKEYIVDPIAIYYQL